jgi:UDP-N-acetylglucosamine diphosphorylase / glucose-1-phosphate thymidylyltransferase / UDP-N-acetylgalactosamine diphosphorylase / glucosamine-1-phosphate N-acetyltransferase / galactosamine-1-phosphate N-acetyltransferase
MLPLTHLRPAEDLRLGILSQRERIVAGIPAIPLPQHAWQLPPLNASAIRHDFNHLTSGRESAPIPPYVRHLGDHPVFIEEGAHMEHCFLNTTDGPIYIGRDALVMDGAMLRGPLAICHNAVVKMGAAIYPGTTIGPHCTIGGEVKNSILMGYSNKAHEGYLGDAVIGYWCNLGAGTSCSNLKNSGRPVKVYDPQTNTRVEAGPKCGLIMGDFSRAAINTSFNTGTVVGICCNVHGHAGLTPTYIRNFTFGDQPYRIEQLLDEIRIWMGFKDMKPDERLLEKIRNLYLRAAEQTH